MLALLDNTWVCLFLVLLPTTASLAVIGHDKWRRKHPKKYDY